MKISESLPICLNKNEKTGFFDEIIIGRFTRISFNRTLRIPEDGREYPLPAGLGRLPIHRVEDYADKVPAHWLNEGGFFIPLYQKEALYLEFDGPYWHPTIAKVAVGRVNAISGKSYSHTIFRQHQDYIVIPDQKWLDGVYSGVGVVRQFVAMQLGDGYTIESQITDEEEHGGFQILVFDAHDGRFPDRDPENDERIKLEEHEKKTGECIRYQIGSTMGIAAGGNIKQQILKDPYGFESWNTVNKQKIQIHLINSLAYKAITGLNPPRSPITIAEYKTFNIPWFEHYDESLPIVDPNSNFKNLLGINQIERARGLFRQDDDQLDFDFLDKIKKIHIPDKLEATNLYRCRARENLKVKYWEASRRDISFVIDLDTNVCSDDYALRSQCNYQMGRFREGAIDGSLGLEINETCLESLIWRAHCRKSLGEHSELDEDADTLLLHEETELLGLEMKAEAAFLARRYEDVLNHATNISEKYPDHERSLLLIKEINIILSEREKKGEPL